MTTITGTQLKELRKKCGYTLEKVHNLTTISSSYLSQIENESVINPSYRTIMTLLELYGAEIVITLPIKI